MGTAGLRAVIIVAALAIGLFLLSRGLGTTGAALQPSAPRAASPSPTVSVPTGPVETCPEKLPEGQSVKVQILNGTGVTGLAAATEKKLERLGYKVAGVGDAQEAHDTTILYYRKDSKEAARCLRETVFPGAFLQKPQKSIAAVQVSIVLGQDYANQQT